MTNNIYAKLTLVQNAVDVPKTEYNDYGNCYYRSVEKIMSALKPKLQEQGLALFINDEIIVVGTENYVKSTVTLIDCETGEKVETSASAKECLHGKMTADQSTISASSYARKAALSGMFLFDNEKEANKNQNEQPKSDKQKTETKAQSKPASSWKNSPSSYTNKPTGNWGNKAAFPTTEDNEVPPPPEPPFYRRNTA